AFTDSDTALLELVAERLAASVERDRLVDREHRAQLAAERARGLLDMLNRAADTLAPVVEDYNSALADLVAHLVPDFADWVSIDLVEGVPGLVREVASGDAD